MNKVMTLFVLMGLLSSCSSMRDPHSKRDVASDTISLAQASHEELAEKMINIILEAQGKSDCKISLKDGQLLIDHPSEGFIFLSQNELNTDAKPENIVKWGFKKYQGSLNAVDNENGTISLQASMPSVNSDEFTYFNLVEVKVTADKETEKLISVDILTKRSAKVIIPGIPSTQYKFSCIRK